MASTAIRSKDWVFNAFWAACGADSANRVSKCSLNIPLTCLFHEGRPWKALATNSTTGFIQRISLDSSTEESSQRSTNERGLRGESLRLFRILRRLLLDFSENNNYHVYQESKSDPFICKVFYTDGQIEDVSLATFDILIRNDSWKKQVMLVQGFVPSLSLLSGNFSSEPQVIFPSNILPPHGFNFFYNI
jgi:hypothetical protein